MDTRGFAPLLKKWVKLLSLSWGNHILNKHKWLLSCPFWFWCSITTYCSLLAFLNCKLLLAALQGPHAYEKQCFLLKSTDNQLIWKSRFLPISAHVQVDSFQIIPFMLELVKWYSIISLKIKCIETFQAVFYLPF